MNSAWYGKGLDAVGADTNLLSDTIKATLVHVASYGIAITAATNAAPVVVTAAAHGLSNGQRVLILGSVGNTAINGVGVVANVTTNTFEVVGSVGNGAWSSGGWIVPLDVHQFFSSVPGGARVGASVTLASKTLTLGVLDAADISFTSLSSAPSVEMIVVHKDSGVEATSPLLLALSGGQFPIAAGAVQVDIQWPNTSGKIATL